MYCVYKHVSPNGKIYIGQTGSKNPNRRWMNGNGYKQNAHFYNAIQKYGWDNFEHVIISDGLTKKEADWLEKYLIAYYETMNPPKGYNHTKGGEGACGYTHTEEHKHKMSELMKGRSFSEESKTRMSVAMKGNKNGLGHTLSDEARQKISEARKGMSFSENHLHNLSKAHIKLDDKLILETYDTSKTVTENYKALLAKGVKLSRASLYHWAERNNIKIVKN